ncbi:MAG: hypothetical protein ABIP94_06845 [Planctomycetota bacterium]
MRVLGLAGFALLANGLLLAPASVPDWLLPAAMMLAAALTRRVTLPPLVAPSRPLAVLCAILVLAAIAAVAWGSLSTGSRYWDGMAPWQMKATVLDANATLEQP